MVMRGFSPQNARRRQWQAFGSALGLEMVLIGALIAWVATHPPTLPEPVIPLSIESIVPAAPENPSVPEKPKLAPPPEQQLPKPVARITPPAQFAALPLPLPVPVPGSQATAPMPATPAPTSQALPAPVSATLPAAVPAGDPSPAYNAKLTAAAQAAFEVPGTVAALSFKGRARIGFKLRDGLASSIAIVQSSGLGAMDRAALKAVQTAAFPQPPPGLQGKEIAYEIWVTHTPAN